MHYLVLTTGSCGNCYIITDDENTIIIDDGVTYKKLSERMEDHDIPMSSVRAMFLTHLHPDHSKGVGVFQRKTGLPVYMSDISWARNMAEIQRQRIEPALVRQYSFGEELSVPGFSVIPFRTFHDSEGSAGYLVKSGSGPSFFIMTDTGIIPDGAEELADAADVMFIESNYDEKMLDEGPYPAHLKKRIKGIYGHLSNTEAVEFASKVARRGESVYFVHVSENNNDTDILRDLAYSKIPSGIFCKICERGELFEGFIDGKEQGKGEEKSTEEGIQPQGMQEGRTI